MEDNSLPQKYGRTAGRSSSPITVKDMFCGALSWMELALSLDDPPSAMFGFDAKGVVTKFSKFSHCASNTDVGKTLNELKRDNAHGWCAVLYGPFFLEGEMKDRCQALTACAVIASHVHENTKPMGQYGLIRDRRYMPFQMRLTHLTDGWPNFSLQYHYDDYEWWADA